MMCATGCSGSTPGPHGNADPDASPPLLKWDGGTISAVDARRCGTTYPLDFDRREADVLILFDRSASMLTEFGTDLGTTTRYAAEARILSELIGAYDDKLRFGFQQFPAPGTCPGASLGCCAQPPSVPMGLGNAAPVIDAIAAAAPVGGSTPTAGALRLAREYFASLDDGISERFVLLSTDGRPSCSAAGKLAAEDEFDASGVRVAGACFDALAEVDALVKQGVKVIVLGVGSGLENDPGDLPSCLEEMAVRGGLPRAVGRPRFYPGADTSTLEMALQQIFGGVSQPSCLLDLKSTPSDPERVAVFFDGREIPRNRAHGWDYEPPEDTTRIKIFGEYCRRLQTFQVTQLELRIGCPPCTSCE
jgi:hypothetical protein